MPRSVNDRLAQLTPQQRAALLQELRANREPRQDTDRIARAGRTEPLPLSFVQQSLWFLDQWSDGLAFYNTPLALRMRGPLDVALLRSALTTVTARHETLRTRYLATPDGPRQVVEEGRLQDGKRFRRGGHGSAGVRVEALARGCQSTDGPGAGVGSVVGGLGRCRTADEHSDAKHDQSARIQPHRSKCNHILHPPPEMIIGVLNQKTLGDDPSESDNEHDNQRDQGEDRRSSGPLQVPQSQQYPNQTSQYVRGQISPLRGDELN